MSRAVSRAGSVSPSAGSGGEVAVSGRSRGSGAKIATVARVAADQRAGGVGGELEDLLDGQRGVERDRGVGQRAQLLDVLVLDPRDLLHLAVAAVDALEDRQALAQEVGAGLQRVFRRTAAVGERPADGGVVRLGQVEHAQLRGDRLAADVVGRAQLALAPVDQIGREGVRIRGRQLGGDVGPGLLHAAKPI